MTTTTRTLTTDLTGPITLSVTAEQMALHVVADPTVATPTAEITGPAELVDQVHADTDGTRWAISVPEPEPTVVRGGQNAVVLGDVRGGITVSGGATVIQGATIRGGVSTTHGPSGTTTVISGSTGADPVSARVRLPEGSSVRNRITSGAVRTTGRLDLVDQQGRHADIEVSEARDVEVDTYNGNISVGRVVREVMVETHNGNVGVAATGERTLAVTHNGHVHVTASSNGSIVARSHNGSVTVRRAGFDPKVRVRCANGSERVLP